MDALRRACAGERGCGWGRVKGQARGWDSLGRHTLSTINKSHKPHQPVKRNPCVMLSFGDRQTAADAWD